MTIVGRVCATCGEFFPDKSGCPLHRDAMQYSEVRLDLPPQSPRRKWAPPIRKRITWGDR